MIFEVAHLLEHLFALIHAAHKKLTSSNCCVIRRLNVKVLGKRVYRLDCVVCKKSDDSFQSWRLRLKHFSALRGFEFNFLVLGYFKRITKQEVRCCLKRFCRSEEHLRYRTESPLCHIPWLLAQHIWYSRFFKRSHCKSWWLVFQQKLSLVARIWRLWPRKHLHVVENQKVFVISVRLLRQYWFNFFLSPQKKLWWSLPQRQV